MTLIGFSHLTPKEKRDATQFVFEVVVVVTVIVVVSLL